MSSSSTRAVIVRFFDQVLNRGDGPLGQGMLADDYKDHHGFLSAPPSAAGFASDLKRLRDAFPDAYYMIDDLRIDGEKAVVQVTFQGTHAGDFLHHPASHRKLTVLGLHLFRVVEGRIAEHWAFENVWSLVPPRPPVPATGVRSERPLSH